MEEIKNIGIYNYLKNINNMKQIQWLVTIKKIENCKNEIEKLYFNISKFDFDYNFNETKSIFYESTKNAFSIGDFDVFWKEIFLKTTHEILIKDYFLNDKFHEPTVIASLEICFNFFWKLYLNSEDIYNSSKYNYPMQYKIAQRAKEIYKEFKIACKEIVKLITLFGYSFNENDFNNISRDQKFKFVKNNYKNLIDSNNSINKDFKSFLIEISIISDLQELEKKFNTFLFLYRSRKKKYGNNIRKRYYKKYIYVN